MSLVEHAEEELRRVGWFDTSSDYAGEIGPAVIELVKVFARQGHSGGSASLVVMLFSRVAMHELLSPLEDPMKSGEYIAHSEREGGCYQSTRLCSVFSADGGLTWYDIDRPKPWWKRWAFRGWKRFAVVKFCMKGDFDDDDKR